MATIAGIRVSGLDKVALQVRRLQAATNTDDILDAAGAFILFRIRERFLKQQDPDGLTWEESEAAKDRKRAGIRGGTLFDTGALFNSISLGRAGPNQRSIFTTIPYARDHQEGISPQKLRVFLGFSLSDEIGVRNLIEARIRDALR